jgi:hypothetical protein
MLESQFLVHFVLQSDYMLTFQTFLVGEHT